MSTAARKIATSQFQKVLEAWPRNTLRPDCQLQEVLSKRLTEKGSVLPTKLRELNGKALEEAELKQVNAIRTLLDNRYKQKYKPSEKLMQPKSNPNYYNDIITELEEAPKRTWFQRMAQRLGGVIRLQ